MNRELEKQLLQKRDSIGLSEEESKKLKELQQELLLEALETKNNYLVTFKNGDEEIRMCIAANSINSVEELFKDKQVSISLIESNYIQDIPISTIDSIFNGLID